jgi:hypothetical protein
VSNGVEGGTQYVPWLGAGYQILKAIGNALPDSYWLPTARAMVEYGNIQIRIGCLAAAGYTLEEIKTKLDAENAARGYNPINIRPEGAVAEMYRRARARIESGQQTQGEYIAACARRMEQYNVGLLHPEEAAAGRPIYGPEGPPPPAEEIEPIPELPPGYIPPVYETPSPPADTGAPTTGPATRTPTSGTGSGGRLDPISLLQALLRIWQNLQNWQRRGPGTIRVSLPDWGGAGLPPTARRPDMYVNTSILGGEGGGWGGLIGQALNTAASIWGPNQAMPGGARMGFQNGGSSFFDLPGIDIVSQGQGSCMGNLTSPFAAGGGRGARAKTHVQCDPVSGRPVWFKPAGRPILWSGDLSACKRVRKVASRARRARGGR